MSVVDPAFAALIADPRTAMRPPAPGADMAAYRARLNGPMTLARMVPLRRMETLGGTSTGLAVDVRVYEANVAARGTILFVHGGGFTIGSLATHDAPCSMLAAASGARVVAVDYRLAPEHPFPAAPTDVLAAVRWAAATNTSRGLTLCGDSAGGHLACGAAIAARAEGIAPDALALLYPVADPACVGETWDRYGEGHVLTRAWMRWAWSTYLDGTDPARGDVTLRRGALDRLPPTLILTAECDPLRDEGEALGQAIAAAGVPATIVRAGGMIHGFASLPMLTPKAAGAIEQIAAHCNQHMR